MSLLFEPIQLGGLKLKNRIVMSPMCQYSADEAGFVQDWHVTHYVSRAVGGVGAIIIEATAVDPDGRISARDLGLWQDEHMERLAGIVRQVHACDVKIGIQLAHAGRKSECAEPPLSPGDQPFSERYRTPRAMTVADIQTVVRQFRQAAVRAKQAGFDFVELHAAHGYLLNQFLSPLVNRRTDEYGGSLAKRFRLLKEVVQAVREVWEDALFVRLSAEEYAEGGHHINDTVEVCKQLKELGVQLIDVSSGAVVPHRIEVGPGYQVPFADQIRREAQIPTGAVGLITRAEQAETILRTGQADLIMLGRELLRNPYWALHAANELGVGAKPPVQYERAF